MLIDLENQKGLIRIKGMVIHITVCRITGKYYQDISLMLLLSSNQMFDLI